MTPLRAAPPRRRLRVLVIDDPAVRASPVAGVVNDADELKLAGRAEGPAEGLQLALRLKPDCICLDLPLPAMEGFTFLRALRAERPTPVVVVAHASREDDALRALELGAADFVLEPGRDPAPQAVRTFAQELTAKLAAARQLRLDRMRAEPTPPPIAAPATATEAPRPRRRRIRPRRVVVIGASTGGPAAVERLLTGLPQRSRVGVVIAQHMPGAFTASFAERLAQRTGLAVRQAAADDEVCAGEVLVAPGDHHLRLTPPEALLLAPRVALDAPGSRHRGYCPSVDLLFASAAEVMGDAVCAVVLTGMGEDGSRGLPVVKAAGGLTLAEAEESALVYAMPRAAVETGCVDECLPLEALRARLRRFAEEG